MAAKKPAKMRDGIIQRAPGKYSYIVRETDPETGAKRNRWVSGFPTREAAKAARDKARADVRKGTYVPPSRDTVGEWLEDWLGVVELLRKPTTASGYRWISERYLVPAIGTVRLQALTPIRLTRLWADLAATGGEDGSSLSPKTVSMIRGTLRTALNKAVHNGLIVVNPVVLSELPSIVKVEDDEPEPLTVWDFAQQQVFLKANAENRWLIAWRIVFGTGLRRGEMCGLRWDAIDLDAGVLTVRRNVTQVRSTIHEGTPKSRDSRRDVPLEPDLVAALRAWKREQAAERLALGLGRDPEDRVLTWGDGHPVQPDYLSKEFARAQIGLGLPRLRLHAARHSYGSALGAAGVPQVVISKLLGHSDIQMTNRYVHATESGKRDAVARLAAAREAAV